MLNRRSSRETSSEAEIDFSTLTAEQLENEYGLSHHFDHIRDETRDDLADEHLDKLIHNSFTQLQTIDGVESRDRYLATLSTLRKSDYYLGLQERLNKNLKLTPAEYMLYAMVTENVNVLDPEALRHMNRYHHVQNFDANLSVLITMREWQNEQDPAAKNELHFLFKDALDRRGSQRSHVEMYLNLHGANLENADLSYTDFDFVDLGRANFAHANLYEVGIHYSNLDHAKLNHTICLHPKHRSQGGVNIKHCTARAARFDSMHADNIDWAMSDFTGSSFVNASIGNGHFTGAIFDNTNFTGGELKFSRTYSTKSCSLQGANLVYATIIGADYDRLNLTGAKLFIDESFANADDLYRSLFEAITDFIDPIRTANTSEWYRESEIKARQNVIANNVIFHLGKSSLSDTDKLELLDAALNHLIFQPEKKLHQLANLAERSLYAVQSTFFSSAPHHEVYATEAIKLLEAERDAIAERCTTPTPN